MTLANFTEEVRDFIADKLTPDLRRAGEMNAGIFSDYPEGVAWLRILNEKGWAVPRWPRQYGGTDWSLDQQAIFAREMTLASAPVVAPNGTDMIGPAIIGFGTEEQKAHYLPRIRNGDDWWAQGYSEPQSGSDLASLQCRAQIVGGGMGEGKDAHYILNGQKIWTTHAQWANKIFCLVRTDNSGKPQHGITFLLFDLDLAGIEIRPLISISGDHEFNQVFFTDVRVPKSGLLGEENQGWSVAKYLLQYERGGSYATALGVRVQRIKEFAANEMNGEGARLADDPDFTRALAEIETALWRLDSFEKKTFAALKSGESAGVMSSMIKICGTEMRQRVTELAIETTAFYALPYQPEARRLDANITPLDPRTLTLTAMPQYLNDRAASIYAGSNEIQRNIMAKALLGL